MSTSSGSLSSPVSASAEKGLLLTGWLVERLVGILEDEFPQTETRAGSRNGDRESSRA
jgi:creatinine amidohydrolase